MLRMCLHCWAEAAVAGVAAAVGADCARLPSCAAAAAAGRPPRALQQSDVQMCPALLLYLLLRLWMKPASWSEIPPATSTPHVATCLTAASAAGLSSACAHYAAAAAHCLTANAGHAAVAAGVVRSLARRRPRGVPQLAQLLTPLVALPCCVARLFHAWNDLHRQQALRTALLSSQQLLCPP